jgi:hypothetical protein
MTKPKIITLKGEKTSRANWGRGGVPRARPARDAGSGGRPFVAPELRMEHTEPDKPGFVHHVYECTTRRHGLMRVAPEAADFKIEIPSVEGIAEAGRGLGGSFESEHSLVPGDTRQTVSFLSSFGRALRRMPNRTASRNFVPILRQCASTGSIGKPQGLARAAPRGRRRERRI